MKTIVKNLFVSATLLTLAGLAQAQVTEKKVLTLDGAKKVIDAARVEAKKLHAPGAAIAVVDDGGNLMAIERLDGTFAAAASLSIGKARTAVLFKRPTRAYEEVIKNGRTAMVALPDSLFTPLQGGIPITVDGQIVGGVGVSGAANSQQDEELATAGANSLNAANAGAPVTYFEQEKVAASFAKGAVLFDAGEKYKIHTSRRDKPGEAELHAQDNDIFYVLDGSATFVTGGEIIGGKTVAAGEIRGPEIKGGEARRISKGDVIIIPAGVPHWFKEVPGTVIYYVVKAR